MRTISFRLDDRTDNLLDAYCRRHGVTQTDALKAAIEHLAGVHRPKPAELAAQLGLIGGFRSAEGDLGQRHSDHVKQRLRAKRQGESLPAAAQPAAPAASRRYPRT